MTLRKYRAKRDFKKTKEPKGTKANSRKKALSFVVQKHYARQLHYDFRLEHRGVLLSWAVPKGPPRVKKVKRLAIHVEDHPLAYGKFEGTIPEGEYGAGKVEIWDEGTYLARDAETVKESEKAIRAGMKKGHLALVLLGKKLKGNYDLVRIKTNDQKKMWLLIKI